MSPAQIDIMTRAMTDLMQRAIERLRIVPDELQDQFAGFVLHELQEDERWTRSTEVNADELKNLIDDVVDADRRGECGLLDPDRL